VPGLTVRLALFYAVLFALVGVRTPYWPLWLEGRGLSATEIGAVLAVGSWMQIVAAPSLAGLIDRRGERRRTIAILAAVAALGYALFAPAHGFAPIVAVSVLVGFAFTPVIPLADNLAMLAASTRGVDYGRARLWGSVGFIAAALGVGQLIAGHPAALVLPILVGLAVVLAALAWTLPDLRTDPHRGRRTVLGLLRQPSYRLFLLATAGLQASHAALYGFSTLHWRSAGIGEATIGWLWAEGVVAEILFFAYGRRLMQGSAPTVLLVAAAIGGLVRWPVLAVSSDVTLLALTQPLHALTFGAAHLGAMAFIARAVEPQLSASAQSLYSATSSGVAFGLAMPLTGFLYGRVDAGVFLLMAGLSAVGLVAALALARAGRTRRPEDTA